MNRRLLRCTFVLLLASGAGMVCPGCSSGQDSDAQPDANAPQDTADGNDGSGENDPSAVCDPSIGYVQPLSSCSADEPCQRLLPNYEDVDELTDPIDAPTCRTSNTDDRMVFDDDAPETIEGIDGTTRYHCEFRPDTGEPRPLVVMFHGSGGSASTVYNRMNLRQQAGQFDWNGHPGFVLASLQGRNLHWPSDEPQDGSKFDFYHRDLDAPSENPDVAYADKLIDRLVDEGDVDPERIHVMGWSNGGHFAQMYAMARHETPTPGGHRVASAAIFSAADPFHETRRPAQDPPCRLDPYPTSAVPLFVVSRACDIIACDEEQAQGLIDDDVSIPAGGVVETWMDDLETRVDNPSATWRIVQGNGAETDRCTGPEICGPGIAVINHVRWPDGVADNSGIDHESDMLQFLADHPL